MTPERYEERIRYHLYGSLEGIEEHAIRIVALEELVEELLPYSGDSCPEQCQYREECESDENRDSHDFPLTCVAYGHLCAKARELGIEVEG